MTALSSVWVTLNKIGLALLTIMVRTNLSLTMPVTISVVGKKNSKNFVQNFFSILSCFVFNRDSFQWEVFLKRPIRTPAVKEEEKIGFWKKIFLLFSFLYFLLTSLASIIAKNDLSQTLSAAINYFFSTLSVPANGFLFFLPRLHKVALL